MSNFKLIETEDRVCLGCGVSLATKSRPQGGGTKRKWCSHRCASRLWHQNHKKRSNATKRKSAAKESCRQRKAIYQKTHPTWARLTPEYKLWSGARTRAREKQIEFSIQPQDIQIPGVCPLLNIPIIARQRCCNGNSPSLDRIDSSKGYVPGNIWVISHRANTVKSDLTLMQLKQLVENLEHFLLERTIHETRG